MKEKKIIGYKLLPNYQEERYRELVYEELKLSKNFNIISTIDYYSNMVTIGINHWFEPVYEEKKKDWYLHINSKTKLGYIGANFQHSKNAYKTIKLTDKQIKELEL